MIWWNMSSQTKARKKNRSWGVSGTDFNNILIKNERKKYEKSKVFGSS
jgi:hypothetical protein